MYLIADSYNYYISAVYFIALVLVCAYFLLNLTVAVMWDNFAKLNQEQKEEEKQIARQEEEYAEGNTEKIDDKSLCS